MVKRIIFKALFILLITQINLVASDQNIFEEAKIYFEKKNYDQSKFLFQKFLVFNPKNYQSYLYLAKIYKKEDSKKKLEKNLNSTLLLDPKNEEALFMLIDLQIEKSNFSEAKELSKKFFLICNKLCKKKNTIAEKIKNLEIKDKIKK